MEHECSLEPAIILYVLVIIACVGGMVVELG